MNALATQRRKRSLRKSRVCRFNHRVDAGACYAPTTENAGDNQ